MSRSYFDKLQRRENCKEWDYIITRTVLYWEKCNLSKKMAISGVAGPRRVGEETLCAGNEDRGRTESLGDKYRVCIVL